MFRREFLRNSLMTTGSLVTGELMLSLSPAQARQRQLGARNIERALERGSRFHDVVLPATKEHPRLSEASMIELKNGHLLFVYSDYYAADSNDTAPARLSGHLSTDRGMSWGEPFVVVENTAANVMAASLLRLKSGAIALFFDRHNDRHSQTRLEILMRQSFDEGRTWVAEKTVVPVGFNGLNNDRVIRLSTDRILAPVFFSLDQRTFRFASVCYYSDDDGETWTRGPGEVTAPDYGADEPVVVELKDRRLLMYVRTNQGRIFSSISHDGGLHWSQSQPTDLVAPSGPCSLKRIPATDDLLLIWSNRPYVVGARRTPLTAAISRDDGRTWIHVQNLEEDPMLEYDYVSILFLDKRVVLSYRVSDKNAPHINTLEADSLKVRVLDLSWFYRRGSEGEPIKAAVIPHPRSILTERQNAPSLSPPDPMVALVKSRGPR